MFLEVGGNRRKPRSSQGQKDDCALDSQVVQYEAAHQGSINTVVSLSPEACVSGGSDQRVNVTEVRREGVPERLKALPPMVTRRAEGTESWREVEKHREREGAVVVYDWTQGRMCQSLQGHTREVTKVVCYPGTTWIFSASRDKTVYMWDLNHGYEPIQEFCGHELVVNGIAVSPDGRKLCSGSRDNWMCLWDIESAKCEQRHNISRNLVTHVCWVPGSSSIAQTSEDKTIRIWDSRAWQVTNTFPAKQYIQTHCDVSLNGNYLVSSSNGFGGQGCEATDMKQEKHHQGYFWRPCCILFFSSSAVAK
ncbi:hypothetical protein WMY93_004713 [Mugilogobius chulae]|uniref:WD repeat domain 31 n=1 Tax=Mugilogobius chulae TaxID=88201 RepID=A0AAW0PPD4_9GOBI